MYEQHNLLVLSKDKATFARLAIEIVISITNELSYQCTYLQPLSRRHVQNSARSDTVLPFQVMETL